MKEDQDRKDRKDSEATVDEALLLVSGSKGDKASDKEYVKKLSNAVLQVFHKHDIARLRCVGAAAIHNGVKAFIIAKGDAQRRGEDIFMNPSFTTVNFNGEEKTGILIEIESE